MATKINAAFLSAAMKAQFDNSSWTKVGDPVALKDIWDAAMPGMYEQIDGDIARVVGTVFDDGSVGYEIVVPIKGGTEIKLKMSKKSSLEEDDEVAIASITGQLIRKAGYEDKVKYDGELYEKEEEEKLAPKKKSK